MRSGRRRKITMETDSEEKKRCTIKLIVVKLRIRIIVMIMPARVYV